LTTEIERLNSILHQRLADIEEWKNRFTRLEMEYNKLKPLEDKVREYENRINLFLKQIDEWREKYSKLEVVIMDLRGYENKCSEYEQKFVLLSQEIERLTNVVRQKNTELDEWKSRTYQLENALNEA